MAKRTPETHTEALIGGIESMRSGVEENGATMYVGVKVKLGDAEAAGDFIVGAARVMEVREAIGFLRHLITDGRQDLLAMARKFEADQIAARAS